MFSRVSQADWWVFSRVHQLARSYARITDVLIFLNYALVALLIALVAARLLLLKNKTALLACMFAPALAYLGSRLIGFFYFRPRPFVTHAFDPLIGVSPLSKSFPSSHAMVSFALAATLIAYDKKGGYAALCIAVLIAMSRIFMGVHYPIDILVGALLGAVVAWITITIV